MEDILRHLSGLTDLSWRSFVQLADIAILTYLNYRILKLVRGSRAWLIIGGVVVFWILLVASSLMQLTALNWLLDKATLLAPVALVILFLPELRQALEGAGKNPVWTHIRPAADTHADAPTIEEVVAAVAEMSASRIGALIVLEKAAPLDDITSSGVILEARVSAALLGSIFYEGNPLHDGAVVIRGDKIVAAACRLPLSDSPRLAANLHMRHRAAVGVTEQRDALAVVVSEERGSISVATEGRLRKLSSHTELREELNRELRGVEEKPSNGLATRLRRSREARRKDRQA